MKLNDPYRFDVLRAEGGGLIGLGCCPGHRLTDWAVRPKILELSSDLEVIANWRPDIVLTLMETRELDMVGAPVATIQSALERAGCGYAHLPIRNLREPDLRFEQSWPPQFVKIDRLLSEGGRIFIHCYAGLGRTGTVAARILMDREGKSAEDAISTVRAVRPGSIETVEQERYLLSLNGRNQG